MKHDLDHFRQEAERCVPHLSPEDRETWARLTHAQHPGRTEAAKTKPVIREHHRHITQPDLLKWPWRALVLAALLFLCARAAHCQDPGGFNGPADPAFRNVPLLWVVNAPSGTCAGVSIQYTFQTNPPALYGCNQGTLTWGQISGSGGGGMGCNPTGGVGNVQASNGSGACQNTSITDNGTRVAVSEGMILPSTVTGGNQGAGTINAVGLYVSGVAVLTSAVTSVATNNGLTGGTITGTGTLGLASIAAGGMLCNTGTTSQPPTIANCGISVPESVTGTVAVSAASPLSLNATTGNLTCGTCATTTNGGALSGTSPITVSAAGAIACSACVINNGTNTGTSAMTINMTASTGANALQLPAQAGLTCSASGCEGFDTAMYHNYTNSVDSLVVTVPASTSLTNGYCAQWVVSGSVKTMGQASGACGSGGSGASNYYETWLTTGTSWTSPSWVDSNTTITIYGCGGGGGGGGVDANGTYGGGGGAGGLFVYTATNAIAGSTGYSYTIGGTGTGGSSSGGAGQSGGQTTFTIGATTYTANGGSGGTGGLSGGGVTASGGTASNGTINITGQNGTGVYNAGTPLQLSIGGNSMFGAGGALAKSATNTAGVAGGPCAGGSGAVDPVSGSSLAGGAGGAGLIHIIVSGS